MKMSGPKPDLNLLEQLMLSLKYPVVKAFAKVVNARLRELELIEKSRQLNKRSARKNGLSYSVALADLIQEDWSELYGHYDNSERRFCVYLHGDPSLKYVLKLSSFENRFFFGRPIYVGMGDYERPYNFVRGRLHTIELSSLLGRGYRKENLIQIARKDLTEREARELEAKLILFYGIKAAHKHGVSRGNQLSGRVSCLLNAQYEPIPEHWMDYTR